MVDVDEEDPVGAGDETYERVDPRSTYATEHAGESAHDDPPVAVERGGGPDSAPGNGRGGYDGPLP